MSHLNDSMTRESLRVFGSDLMTRDLDDPINEALIKCVIMYKSAVRFPIYTQRLASHERLNDSVTLFPDL